MPIPPVPVKVSKPKPAPTKALINGKLIPLLNADEQLVFNYGVAKYEQTLFNLTGANHSMPEEELNDLKIAVRSTSEKNETKVGSAIAKKKNKRGRKSKSDQRKYFNTKFVCVAVGRAHARPMKEIIELPLDLECVNAMQQFQRNTNHFSKMVLLLTIVVGLIFFSGRYALSDESFDIETHKGTIITTGLFFGFNALWWLYKDSKINRIHKEYVRTQQ